MRLQAFHIVLADNHYQDEDDYRYDGDEDDEDDELDDITKNKWVSFDSGRQFFSSPLLLTFGV